MDPTPKDAGQDEPQPPHPWLKPAGFVAGVVLLGAAVWAAWGQREAVLQGLRSAAGARWWLIALMLGLPLLNWVLSSALFMLLMQPGQRVARRPVRFVEMLWLIGASWLLNYLPMAPGLLGRVAYHRRVHGIPVRQSVQAVGAGLMISVAALGLPLLMAVVFPGLFPTPGGLVPLLVLAGVFLMLGLIDRARGRAHWWLALAMCVRSVDIAVWTVRYAVVMAVLGLDWTWAGAAAVAIVSQIAVLVPLATAAHSALDSREAAALRIVKAVVHGRAEGLPALDGAGRWQALGGRGLRFRAVLRERQVVVCDAVHQRLWLLWREPGTARCARGY